MESVSKSPSDATPRSLKVQARVLIPAGDTPERASDSDVPRAGAEGLRLRAGGVSGEWSAPLQKHRGGLIGRTTAAGLHRRSRTLAPRTNWT